LDDSAAILPISKKSFAQTTIYECFADNEYSQSMSHSEPYLKLVVDFKSTCAKLKEFVEEIEACNEKHLTLDAMPDYEDATVASAQNWQDNKAWNENIPNKIGLYHSFMRTNTQSAREHKVFLIITGECKFASEELYNLWLDARHSITARQFAHCAELNWLRNATARHHNRLAAKLAKKMNLNLRLVQDNAAAEDNVSMALPANNTVYYDIVHDLASNKMYVTSEAVYLKNAKSGILADYSNEGFWCFHGPNDTQTYRTFGTNMNYNIAKPAFPCSSIKYHAFFQPKSKANVISYSPMNRVGENANDTVLYANKERKFTSFLFPHQSYLDLLLPLGFDRQNQITCLMPIIVYCTDE
jgi:hypothetical protein